MKQVFNTLLLILLSCCLVHAQNPAISPAVTAEICPGLDIQIQFTGVSSSDYIIKNDATLKGCTITANIDGNGHAVLKFSDKKEAHEFVLHNPTTSVSYTYKFTKIKTIDGLKPTYPPGTPGVTPYTPDYDDAISAIELPPCGTSAFNYTCPVLKYKDASGNDFGNFGMSFSEWLVPKGWKVNGTISDGVSHIATSGNAANITPDPIIGGELKYRAKNDCSPATLKTSNYYKVLILRPSIRLTAGGQNPITITCGESVSRTFTLENINLYSACLTGTYIWNLGATPNGWKDVNGNPAPATITTTTPSLTLSYAGTLTAPSNVSVTLTHANGSTYVFTTTVNFNQCTSSVFSVTPASVPVTCNVPSTHTLTVNTMGNIAGVTGYVWNLGVTPNGWKNNGNPAPASITTTTPSLTLTSDGSLTNPSNITVTPYIDNVAFPYSYTSSVSFTPCCAYSPGNLNTASTGSNGYVILGWDAVSSATNYTVEYMAIDGSNHNTFTTSNITTSYYGPSTIDAKFRVKATCPTRTSDWSDWKTFSVTAPPACNLSLPTNLVASNACGSGALCGYVYYNWTPVSGATAYEIEAVVFNISTGQALPATKFEVSSPPIYYGSYSGISGTGWNIHFRIRAKCANNSWTNFSNWSPTFAL